MRRLATLLLLSLPLFAQNAALQTDPNPPFLDNNGKPVAGGKLYTCSAGTTCPGNPLATYTDITAGTPNANPVILDSTGRAPVYIGSSPYKFVLQNSLGVQVWTRDNVTNNGFVVSGSLAASNSASLVKYTPSATGGQTRTLQAIHGDMIDAASYDTISHAFADACATTPGKTVYIPSTISGSQTYTNSCAAPVYDGRIGTSATPASSRTFTAPMFGGTFYDASAATTNVSSQGDGAYAPITSIRVFESGAATAPALYTEYHAGAGATGGAYGLSANVSADPGSVPRVVAHNWTIQDATHYWLNGCTRASGVMTCNIATGGSNPAFSLQDANGVNHCFYVTGSLDSALNNSGLIQCPTSVTSSSVTFNNAGSDVSIAAGGWLSPSHQVFGFELNSNNASHDPGHITPGSTPLPVWGYVSQNTPFTWTNPTSGANIPNQPLSAGFFASGTSSVTNAGQYTGFLAQDAIDDLFTAGYPIVGGTVSTAKSAYRSRPIAAAINGTNYRSHYSCWDSSVWNGVSTYNEASYCMGFIPVSNSSSVDSTFQLFQKGWESTPVNFYKQGHLSGDSGSSGAVTYGFNGWTNGIYNNAGVTSVSGALATTGNATVGGALATTGNATVGGSTNSVSGYQTNGTAGLSATINVRNSTNTGACTITVTGGLVTATTCP